MDEHSCVRVCSHFKLRPVRELKERLAEHSGHQTAKLQTAELTRAEVSAAATAATRVALIADMLSLASTATKQLLRPPMSTKRNPQSLPAVWCLLILSTCSFCHEIGKWTSMRACACVRISSFAPSESSKNDSPSISALGCLLTLITWQFFHEMGTGYTYVRVLFLL